MPPRRSQPNTQANLHAVRLDQLVLMQDLQVRVQLDPQTVRTYREIFRTVPEDQCTCPPISVYLHQGSYVVADGFHRVTAARQAGRTTLNAYVREGSLDDAWQYAVDTNLKHGMPYSREDKQKIVLWYLNHERYGSYSTRDIAKLTGNMIPHSTVANIRNRQKLEVLQDASNLDEVSRGRPSLDEQLRQVERAYGRMQDSAAVMIGVAQELPGGGEGLLAYVTEVRQSLARLKAYVDRLEDLEDSEDA